MERRAPISVEVSIRLPSISVIMFDLFNPLMLTSVPQTPSLNKEIPDSFLRRSAIVTEGLFCIIDLSMIETAYGISLISFSYLDEVMMTSFNLILIGLSWMVNEVSE